MRIGGLTHTIACLLAIRSVSFLANRIIDRAQRETVLNGSTVSGVNFGIQLAAPTADADFDGDADVDGADFLAWQRGFGLQSNANKSDGDADNDGDVDATDLGIWQNQYGGLGAIVAGVSSADSQSSSALIVNRADSIGHVVRANEITDAAIAAAYEPPSVDSDREVALDAQEPTSQQLRYSAVEDASTLKELLHEAWLNSSFLFDYFPREEISQTTDLELDFDESVLAEVFEALLAKSI